MEAQPLVTIEQPKLIVPISTPRQPRQHYRASATYDYVGQRFRNELREQLKKYGGFVIGIFGNAGTGKSSSAIAIGEILDPNFKVTQMGEGKCNVAFKASDFVAKLNDPINYPEGSVIVFDEAGTGISSRTWYDAAQKSLNYALQIIRARKLIIILTTPDASFIDSQVRKLFRYFFETKGIDFNAGYVLIRPYKISVNRLNGKIYYYYPVIVDNIEGYIKIKELRTCKPRNKTWDNYLHLKNTFNELILAQAVAANTSAEQITKKLPSMRELSALEIKTYEMIVQGYDNKYIADKLNKTRSDISGMRGRIKDKGFPLPIAKKKRDVKMDADVKPENPNYEEERKDINISNAMEDLE